MGTILPKQSWLISSHSEFLLLTSLHTSSIDRVADSAFVVDQLVDLDFGRFLGFVILTSFSSSGAVASIFVVQSHYSDKCLIVQHLQESTCCRLIEYVLLF